MEALLLKDLCVLWKQMRMMLLILAFLSVVGGAFNSVFVVVWCALLPYTAIAYDERSHWNQLAAMMPYSVRDVVLSKYALGWLCAAVAGGIALVSQAVIRLLGLPLATGTPALVFLGLCASVCVLAISLPTMLRFGVERGRMGMFLMIFLVCAVAGALGSVVPASGEAVSAGEAALLSTATVAAPIAAVVLTAVSIPLSLRLYAARR